MAPGQIYINNPNNLWTITYDYKFNKPKNCSIIITKNKDRIDCKKIIIG